MYEALDGADALVICTEWSIFRTPDFQKVKQLLNQNIIFDGRNLYDHRRYKERRNFIRINREIILKL